MRYPVDILLEETGGIVEGSAIKVSDAGNDLQGMPQRVINDGQVCHQKTQRTPDHLLGSRSDMIRAPHPASRKRQTTVIVSMLVTNPSAVRYRESDLEYSFHNCASTFCDPAICAWWVTRYPSKPQCRAPAMSSNQLI